MALTLRKHLEMMFSTLVTRNPRLQCSLNNYETQVHSSFSYSSLVYWIQRSILGTEIKSFSEKAKVFIPLNTASMSSCKTLMQNSYCNSVPAILRRESFLLHSLNAPMFMQFSRGMASLYQMHRRGPPKKERKGNKILGGRPQLKGVVLKTLVMKPRKPNSANRKCVLVRLSNGKEATAFVPGIGHNLQEHNIVLIEGCCLRDVPGIKLRVVRGKYDCRHVEKPSQ